MEKFKNKMENVIGVAVVITSIFGAISLLTGFQVNFIVPDLPYLMRHQIAPIPLKVQKIEIDSDYVKKAESLGFEATTRHIEAMKNWEIARSKYPVLSQSQIDSFRSFLENKTLHTVVDDQWHTRVWHTLAIEPISAYPGFVPKKVLGDMEKARELGVFEDFQVMSIKKQNQIISRDPVLVATVKGYPMDYFVISVWLIDTSFDDIIKK